MSNWFTKLFKAKVQQPTPVGHTINVPHIRCIAQQILNDLDIKNEADWESQYVSICGGRSGRTEMTLRKLYTLCLYEHEYDCDSSRLNLKGVDGFSFNCDESEAIREKIRAMENFRYHREEQKRAK
jgi:hypothetical protein